MQSTLAKLSVCRTGALGAKRYSCAECGTGGSIANSCGDRHCPQCRGASRVNWVDRMRQLLLPNVDYYQVVFTIPASLSRVPDEEVRSKREAKEHSLSTLALGNRRVLFNLLFHSAWQSLKQVIEDEQQFEAAAAMVLHTWNQHLDAHIHVHAIVPGGGPSLERPIEWKSAQPPSHRSWQEHWLVDADTLRQTFREIFLNGLRSLHRRGQLKLDGEFSQLRDAQQFESFLAPLQQQDWVTYIEPPPAQSSDPTELVKYLARYLTGGPISDHRIARYDGRNVTFTARTGQVHGGSNESEEVTLPAIEFLRRWSLHILPKQFTKTRHYGGWSNHHRAAFIQRGQELLDHLQENTTGEPHPFTLRSTTSELNGPRCATCGGELELIDYEFRTSWRDVFALDSRHRPAWYRPWEAFT